MLRYLMVFFVICGMMFIDCKADTYELTGSFPNWHKDLTYKPDDVVKAAWGNPEKSMSDVYIQDRSSNYGDFRIKEGWAWPNGTTAAANNPQNDQAIMSLIAHNITEHGAEFCLTQISVANSSRLFSIYFQQPNLPGLQCAWFCEPGWDGVACKDKTSSDNACNTTDYVEEISRVKKNVYGGNDAISSHWHRMGVAESVAVLGAVQNGQSTKYQHEIVIGATKFMQHGIVASPILIAGVGNDAPSVITSSLATSGITKTLCAQGFTKDENCSVASKHCGSDVFCVSGDEKKFNSNKGHTTQINGFCKAIVCKDADKALDENYECKDCPYTVQSGRCSVPEKNLLGRCVHCDVGKYFDQSDCSCKEARMVTKEKLQYGDLKNAAVTLQCWAMTNANDYNNCVIGSLNSTTNDSVK